MRRISPVVPEPRPGMLAAALVALSQVEVWWYGAGGGGVVAAVTLGLAGAFVAWRNIAPVSSAALVLLALMACGTWAGEPGSATAAAAVAICFFTIGAMVNRRRALIALAGAMVLGTTMAQPFDLQVYLAITLTSFLVPWLVGDVWRRHRATIRADEDRQSAASAAVAEERLRLARELHDTVSHNVGMIAVQAGAADVLLDKDVARTRESLRAIEGGARETLLELRRLLGLLRDDDPNPVGGGATLDELEQLVARARAAGVQVELRIGGEPVALDRTLELTVYRIVQEGLTNAIAHAAPCRVTVTVGYAPDRLEVDMVDDGEPKGGTSRGGYGLVGLHERAIALGGQLDAGPRSGGGFRLHALLPFTAP